MKKLIFTIVLSSLLVVYLFAQSKKLPVSQASMKRGAQVYKTTCNACHQKNGTGVPRLNPPLIKTEYVLGNKARLTRVVLKGLNQTIEIDDEEYTNAMPAFAQLTDQQIADVLTYVRNSFGNKASAITPAFVKAERAKTK